MYGHLQIAQVTHLYLCSLPGATCHTSHLTAFISEFTSGEKITDTTLSRSPEARNLFVYCQRGICWWLSQKFKSEPNFIIKAIILFCRLSTVYQASGPDPFQRTWISEVFHPQWWYLEIPHGIYQELATLTLLCAYEKSLNLLFFPKTS